MNDRTHSPQLADTDHTTPHPQPADIRSSAERTRDAALNFLALVRDPVVVKALSGHSTSNGRPFDGYLFPVAADAVPTQQDETLPQAERKTIWKGTPEQGRVMLEALSEGKPVRAEELRDLMLGVRETLILYNGEITKLHKIAEVERATHARASHPELPVHRSHDAENAAATDSLETTMSKTNAVILAAQQVLGAARAR